MELTLFCVLECVEISKAQIDVLHLVEQLAAVLVIGQ
jgi:hypothetical protein